MGQRKLKKIRREQKEIVLEPGLKVSNVLDLMEVIKRSWLFLILVSLLTVAIYANGLVTDFVSDDYASISQNPEIGNLAVMWAGGNSSTLMNYLTFKFFGYGSTLPYHLVSLLIYIAILWLVFIFVAVVMEDYLLAMLTVIIFALHPIHVEAVTWISGRLYLTIAACVLGAILLVKKYLEKRNVSYMIWAGLLFLIAFQTDRPRPLSFFLILTLFVFFKGVSRFKIDWIKFLFVTLTLLTAMLAIMWPNISSRIGSVNSGYNSSESVFYNPLFQYPTGVTKYLQLLWMPFDLTLYHTMFTLPNWLNWSIFLIYLTLIGYFYFRDRRYFFALGFILAGVLPSMAPVKVSWLVAERYMFLGSLGFCLFLGLLFESVWKRNRVIPAILLAVLLSFYGVRTVLRNVDWQTNHNLWVNTCQVSPNSHNAWNNIGDDYDKLKDYENAIKGFTQSTVVKPNYADAYHNRANIFFKIGRLDLARDSYQTALYYSPGLFQTYLSLTQIDLIEKRYDLALEHAKSALNLQPNNPQAAYVLAVVYGESGDVTKASDILRMILGQYPNYQLARDLFDRLNSQ